MEAGRKLIWSQEACFQNTPASWLTPKGKQNGCHYRKNPEIKQLARWKNYRSRKRYGNKLVDQGMDRDAVLTQLEAVRQNPGSFLVDSLYADLARECIRITQKDEPSPSDLRESPLPFPIWGRENIDDGAIAQMNNAMRLPVTVTGALMPDAHIGYGLPIAACWQLKTWSSLMQWCGYCLPHATLGL